MNLKNGCIEQFEQYSQFSSLKEFKSHMERWLAVYKDNFSKGERVGLKSTGFSIKNLRSSILKTYMKWGFRWSRFLNEKKSSNCYLLTIGGAG